jgi:hypothetical protein
VKALEERLGLPVNVCGDSHYIGAIGAAIFALERALGGDIPDGPDKLSQTRGVPPAASQPGGSPQLKVI